MDTAIKNYIDSLDRRSIPWNRMFTAYGTAERYNELLSVLEKTTDEAQWKKTFSRISDFEHQSTMFPPAPFVLVFLVRILQKHLQDGSSDGIAKILIDQLTYYTGLCDPDAVSDELFYSFYYYSGIVLAQVPDILKTTSGVL